MRNSSIPGSNSPSFARFPVPVVSVPPAKCREACAIGDYCYLTPASEETEAQGFKPFGARSLRQSVIQALPKASTSADVLGGSSLTEMGFILAHFFFSCTIYSKDFQSGFPAAANGTEKNPKAPKPWDHLFVSALDGMCYTGEEVWGLFGMQLPTARYSLAWAHRLGMLAVLLCTPVSATLVLKCK